MLLVVLKTLLKDILVQSDGCSVDMQNSLNSVRLCIKTA